MPRAASGSMSPRCIAVAFITMTNETMNKPISPESLRQLFLDARSVNGFLERDVPDSLIHSLYEIQKWGPTSMNCQPARYVFLRSAAQKQRLAQFLSAGNVDKTLAAPVTMIIATDKEFFHNLSSQFKAYDARPLFESNAELARLTALRNASLQGAYVMLAARSLGLDCGPMSGFDASALNREFFPEGRFEVNFLLNLGYGDPGQNYPRGPRLAFEETSVIL